MKLSDIPFDQLQTTEDWLTSANGLPGRIFSISHHEDGKFYKTYLTIRWKGPEGIKVSIAEWPDDCRKIEVDLSNKGLLCRPYAEDQIKRREREIEFYKQFSKVE
jgi:hypothetical protein